MSFRMIVRGVAHRTARAEYECPAHGRFEAEVERDANGDPPERIPCPTLCEDSNFPLEEDVECGRTAEYRISAPLTRVRRIEAIKGKWEKPERKEWQDVSKLAEGQSLDEFWAERAAIREEERKREVVAFAREHHESIAGIEDVE